MKLSLFAFLMMAVGFVACNGGAQQETPQPEDGITDSTAVVSNMLYRGDSITADGAITPAQMLAEFEKNQGFEGKIETEVISCCQKKGCWMKVDLGNGEEMRVTFKDYGFFVPLESAGKKVIMQGSAYTDTVSVDMLKHLAEDAGKTEEEIEAINQPEVTLAFEATGLIIEE